jgi:MFS family permease
MTSQPSQRAARVSTRLIFALGGIVLGSWAPLVPLAKTRLNVDEGTLGLLLLCMGLGSLLAMPITGYLTNRFGPKPVISVSGLGLCLVLLLAAMIDQTWLMALNLVLFGAVMGCLSVSMNLQSVLVERAEGKAILSGFHAMFSLGGIIGSGLVSFLLAQGTSAVLSACAAVAVMLALLFAAQKGLLRVTEPKVEKAPAFVVPKGVVIAIGVLSLLAMLAEGSVLDWGALFMIEAHDAQLGTAGFAYTAFALTMTAGRLVGDRLRTGLGDLNMLIGSAALALIGFLISLFAPGPVLALGGFLLVGAGLSNIAPILFTLTGKTKAMPANLAIASVLTVGYLGIIAGPAGIGFIAHATSLSTAFALLCFAMVIIMVSAKSVFRNV